MAEQTSDDRGWETENIENNERHETAKICDRLRSARTGHIVDFLRLLCVHLLDMKGKLIGFESSRKYVSINVMCLLTLTSLIVHWYHVTCTLICAHI